MSNLIGDIDSARAFIARINEDFPIAVLFHARWCPACRGYRSTVRDLADAFNGRLAIVRVDIDDHGPIAAGADIRLVPTVVVYQGGQQLGRAEGARSFREMTTWLEQYAVPLPIPARTVPPEPGIIRRLARVFAA